MKNEISHRRSDINLNNSEVINLGISAAAIWMRFSIDAGKAEKNGDHALLLTSLLTINIEFI